MQVTRLLFDRIADLLAADTDTLAAATALHVHLVINNFTPSLGTSLDDLDFATFTGGAPKSAGTGEQQVFNDVTTGERVVQLLEPAGGWTWECTATPGAPETVFGYAVTNTANDELYGCARLTAPITIDGEGQGFTVGNIRIPFSPALFS